MRKYQYEEEVITHDGYSFFNTYDEDEPDYSNPVGKCANCGDIIYGGDGPTVHDICQAEFIYYLNHPDEP